MAASLLSDCAVGWTGVNVEVVGGFLGVQLGTGFSFADMKLLVQKIGADTGYAVSGLQAFHPRNCYKHGPLAYGVEE